jgi:hypothetical protein
MAEQELKHYRYGGKLTHIGMEALPSGKDITVVIDRIAWVESEVVNGEKKPCWVAYFQKNPYFDLPMILNATNKKRIARLAEDQYLERVKNLPVTLTKEMDKAIGGGKDWSLRVSVIKPKITPQGQVIKIALTPTSGNWASIVKWVQDGNAIEKVTAKYEVSPEDMVTFKQAIEVKEVAEDVKETAGEETQSQPTDEPN